MDQRIDSYLQSSESSDSTARPHQHHQPHRGPTFSMFTSMSISFCKAPLAKILKLGSEVDFDKVTSNCKFYMTFKNNPFPKEAPLLLRYRLRLSD